jgi:hypothetical protein
VASVEKQLCIDAGHGVKISLSHFPTLFASPPYFSDLSQTKQSRNLIHGITGCELILGLCFMDLSFDNGWRLVLGLIKKRKK